MQSSIQQRGEEEKERDKEEAAKKEQVEEQEEEEGGYTRPAHLPGSLSLFPQFFGEKEFSLN